MPQAFAYIISNINVLILRHRLPKAPRTFKVPGGPVLPLIGAAGNVFMIANIDSDPQTKLQIYMICGAIFIALGIYSVLWIKKVMKLKLFKPLPVHQVMAMENDAYRAAHRRAEMNGR